MDRTRRPLRKLSSIRKHVNKVKYQPSQLAFLCEWQQQYESRLCIPICPEWTRLTIFLDSTILRATVTPCTLSAPIFARFKQLTLVD
ncbi:hypothetical protein HOY80DRAFT_689959 [Tuber brumale]|nr:hypothetical protein HOY80DRAFT_689959 [Tuber brumale]